MIHDTPPYGHAPIPNIIDLSQKKQLFDLKVISSETIWQIETEHGMKVH
jgi:hypothetical protein